MKQRALPQKFGTVLLDHLRGEVQVLTQIRGVSAELVASGLTSHTLQSQRPKVDEALQNLVLLQQQRQKVLTLLAQVLNCSPGDVMLSQIQLHDPLANESLRELRNQLRELTIQTSATVRTTQTTLGNWNAIVSSVLDVVLAASVKNTRYTSSGQRVTPVHAREIDLRS